MRWLILAEIRLALNFDPLSLIINEVYGTLLSFARRYDESNEQLKKTINMDANFPESYCELASNYQIKGMYPDSVEQAAKCFTLSGEAERAAKMKDRFTGSGIQAVWRGEIQDVLANKNNSVPPYFIAFRYALLGEKEKAFEYLEKAYQGHDTNLVYLKEEPVFDNLREDARFQDLLRRLGFPS